MTSAPPSDTTDDIEAATLVSDDDLARLWPGDLPEPERLAWARLPSDRRIQALRRLAALVGRRPSDDRSPLHGSVREAAAAAGVAVPTFHAIVRRWRDAPTLGSLGVHVPSDRHVAPVPSTVIGHEVVRDLMRAHPHWRAPDLHSALVAAGIAGSYTSTLRLWREARRMIGPGGVFGAHVVFDSAGLDLQDETGRRLRMCAAIDVGTGLVLGWDLSPEGDILLGYRFAARHAAYGRRARHPWPFGVEGGLQDLDLSGGVSGSSSLQAIELRLTPENADAARLSDDGTSVPTITVAPDVRVGRLVGDTLGERLGGLWLGSGVRDADRSYRTGRPVRLPTVNPVLWGQLTSDVVRHNRRRAKALAAGGDEVPDWLIPALGDAFKRLVATITTADPSTSRLSRPEGT